MDTPTPLQAPVNRLAPMHPGELLREVVFPALKASGNDKGAIAEHLKLDRMGLSRLERCEKDVDAELALRLGKLLGNGGEFWLNLQAAYDLAIARNTLAGELDAIPTLQADKAA